MQQDRLEYSLEGHIDGRCKRNKIKCLDELDMDAALAMQCCFS